MSYVLNQCRGGCGRNGFSDFHGQQRRPCRDYDPRTCCDCATPPDCFEGSFWRDPIYRGACPPDPEPCSRDWANNIYAHCTQMGRLKVKEEGGRIPFDAICNYTSGAFRHCRGQFQLICGGIYLVFVQINVPAGQTLSTRISLRVDGVEVPGGSVLIEKPNTGYTANFGINAAINANAGSVLTLHSSNVFDLCGPDVLATITILKVG